MEQRLSIIRKSKGALALETNAIPTGFVGFDHIDGGTWLLN
jgi:hypothetical protein